MSFVTDVIDVIQTQDGTFTVLISLRANPIPETAVEVVVQVLSQNGSISNFGGWVVRYSDRVKIGENVALSQHINTQHIDQQHLHLQYIGDTKTQISLFVANQREDWYQTQSGTFTLERISIDNETREA